MPTLIVRSGRSSSAPTTTHEAGRGRRAGTGLVDFDQGDGASDLQSDASSSRSVQPIGLPMGGVVGHAMSSSSARYRSGSPTVHRRHTWPVTAAWGGSHYDHRVLLAVEPWSWALFILGVDDSWITQADAAAVRSGITRAQVHRLHSPMRRRAYLAKHSTHDSAAVLITEGHPRGRCAWLQTPFLQTDGM